MCAATLRHGAVVEAYSSLARGAPELLASDAVTRIAAKHGKTASQVALRWAVQHGYVIIPKSTHGKLYQQ